MEKKVVNAVVEADKIIEKCDNTLNNSLQDMIDVICEEHKGEKILTIEVNDDAYYPVLDQCTEEIGVGIITRFNINVPKKNLTEIFIDCSNGNDTLYWEDLDLNSRYTVILAISEVYFKNKEDDEKDKDMEQALDYIRERLEDYELEEIRVKVNSAYEQHTTPTAYDDFSHIADLLEEYGEDNDYPEGWWMELGDLDDWVVEI